MTGMFHKNVVIGLTDSEFLSKEFLDTFIEYQEPKTKGMKFIAWLQKLIFSDTIQQIEIKQTTMPVYLL